MQKHWLVVCIGLEYKDEGWLARDINMDTQCNSYLSTAYQVPDTVLGTWDKSVNKPDKSSCPP